jgi:hypothetical protein
MANYNKSFNFRNGVQVDEDNFLVASTGLVGIGTTIPRYDLDVYGNTNVVGLITSKDLVVSGIASFTNVVIGTGITIYGNTGIISATFYGDGSNLQGVPTSQWVDINSGAGYTSIYSRGNVGVATTSPTSSFQVGGSPEIGQGGVSISSEGNVKASGIITAGYFDGDGSNLTNLNASNVSSGTLSNSRLPSSISVGFVSATNFTSGVSTIGFLTATNSYLGFATVGFATISTLYAGVGTVGVLTATQSTIGFLSATSAVVGTGTITTLRSTTGIITSLSNTFLNSGVGTVGVLTATTANISTATITNITVSSGISTSLQIINANIGVATVGFITASFSNLGVVTASSAKISNINISVNANKIETSSGNLTLDSIGGTIIVDDNFNVTGVSTFESEVTVNTGIVPDASGAYLGSSAKPFSQATIKNIRIGFAGDNNLDTSSGNLTLSASSDLVDINDNLNVSGISTFIGAVTVNTGIVPDVDLDAYLGSNSKYFSGAYVGDIQIGAAASNKITTRNKDLTIDSNTNNVLIDSNLTITGITTINDRVYISGITSSLTGFIPYSDAIGYLGSSDKRFSALYVDNIKIGAGVGNDNKIESSSGDINLSSAGKIALNALSGNIELTPSTGLTTATGSFNVSENVSIKGTANIVGVTTVQTGLLPSSDTGAYLGSSTKSFSEAHIDGIRVGYSGTTTIDTRGGNLILNSTGNSTIIQSGITSIQGDLRVVNDSYLTGILSVAYNTTTQPLLYVDVDNGVIGVGTGDPYNQSPNSNLFIYDSAAQFDLFSTTGGSSIIKLFSDGGTEGRITYNTNGDLILESKVSTGNLDFILNNSGFAGVSSGNFRWKNGFAGSEIATLTWDGKFGINNDEPNSTLNVVGTSSITGNSYFGSNVNVDGNLYVTGIATFVSGINITNDSLPNIITKNINVTSGFSTFNDINIQRLGINTNNPLVEVDAKNSRALFSSIGIGTTGTTENIYNNISLLINGRTVIQSTSHIGIGTTSNFYPGGDPEVVEPTGLEGDIQLFGRSIDLYNTNLNIFKESAVGFNTDLPRGVMDFGYADDSASYYPVVVLPNIDTNTRNGIGDTATGAVIFNTSSNTFQGWDGTSWVTF